ncbi:MAG: hypothetical protein CMJ31_05450 [Phycisphaerae bacterium]|nr:hypothetical protein [Phycisphaerae bacterium]
MTDVDAREAVEELARRHGGTIFGIASRLCGSREEAEDLTQEVFLQAYRRWETFDGRSNPTTWLYTIAARACQRLHQKRADEPDEIGSLDALLPFGDPLVATVPGADVDGLGEQVRREARERLQEAIAALPDEFRMPLILKEIVGLSVPEVGIVLGLETGTVKSRVHRARLRLRHAIEHALPKEAAPAPAYDRQTCLDLLAAKQEALDRGVPFDQGVICERCRSVFDTLDLAGDFCRELGRTEPPAGLIERLRRKISV